jgi:hypothetical protein
MTEAGNAWRVAMGFIEMATLEIMRADHANLTNGDQLEEGRRW